jgi:hypothetical protein
VAEGIIRQSATELATAASTVACKLGLIGRAVPLALTGGTVLGNEHYVQLIVETMRQQQVPAQPVTPVREPAEGALRISAARIKAAQP